MRRLAVFALSLIPGGALAAAPTPPSLAELLAATAGDWQGELQYRDYQSDKWEGLPVKVKVQAQGDGVTVVRTAAFDDGPKTGIVYITTVTQLDPATGRESYAAFRKNREPDSGTAQLLLGSGPRDLTHWTIITTETRKDGDSLALVRETTTRDGTSLVTLKEVDPVDDGVDGWLPRNRTVLELVGNS